MLVVVLVRIIMEEEKRVGQKNDATRGRGGSLIGGMGKEEGFPDHLGYFSAGKRLSEHGYILGMKGSRGIVGFPEKAGKVVTRKWLSGGAGLEAL